MAALFVPSPLAKRWGEVNRNCARYKEEHFKDILQASTQKFHIMVLIEGLSL
jgi:hypothetical protein